MQSQYDTAVQSLNRTSRVKYIKHMGEAATYHDYERPIEQWLNDEPDEEVRLRIAQAVKN